VDRDGIEPTTSGRRRWGRRQPRRRVIDGPGAHRLRGRGRQTV